MPRGWILLDDDKIAGYLGIVPVHFQLDGKVVTSFNSTTWRVLEAYRNHSLRLFYQALNYAKGSIFFNTTPSEDVARILRAHRFRVLPHAEHPGKSVIIVDPQRLLSSSIRIRGVARAAAWAIAPVIRALQGRGLRPGSASGGMEVVHLTHADSCFDELWLRTRHLYANTNVRSAAAINWQCFANDDFKKLLFGCFRQRHLEGYLIASGGVRNGLKVLSCLDLWLDPDALSAMGDLLGQIERWACQEGFDLIEIPHFDGALARRLTSLGLVRRSMAGEQLGYYRIPARRTLDPTTSYFVGLQGDRGL